MLRSWPGWAWVMSSKTDIVMAVLATGIYRPWFWQHYPTQAKQDALRARWALAVAKYSREEIRAALMRWTAEQGVNHPPTPEGLMRYLKPSETASSRQFFKTIKETLREAR
jgi:hypothetical protein